MIKNKIIYVIIIITALLFTSNFAFGADLDTVNLTVTKQYDKAFEVLEIVNEERNANGLKSVTMSSELMENAMLRAVESALYFSHTRPNGNSFWTAITISYTHVGENIAIGYTSSESVMEGWMNSEGHRANILTKDFSSMGVGCVYNNGLYTWVQLFSSNDLKDGVKKNNSSATYAVEIQDSLMNLKFNKSTVELLVGDSYKNNLYFVNDDVFLSSVDVSQFIITNSNPSVATFAKDGTVTAKSIGETTIKISTKTGKSFTFKVVVTKPSIKFSSSYINVNVGDVVYLSDYVTITPSSYQSIYNTEITSSNSSVASVYNSYAAIVAQKEGVSVIKVKLKNGTYATLTVRVGDAIFADVTKSNWYFNAVKYCYQNKIVNGTSTSTFSPNAKVTRGMVATMLYAMAGTPSVSGTCKFTDVSSSKYYYNAVRWASANKIVNGYTGTSKFGPEDYITREQLAIMLTNYAVYKNKYKAPTSNLNGFSDASAVSTWAKDSVRWAIQNKIINGSNGKINPKGNATRAEVATMIYSYRLNIK